MDDFYLHLHCGDSLVTHTDNHAGDFVVDLPKTYQLDGHWGCALTEIAMSIHGQNSTERQRYLRSLLHSLCSNVILTSFLPRRHERLQQRKVRRKRSKSTEIHKRNADLMTASNMARENSTHSEH
jgi:hypothetical protein